MSILPKWHNGRVCIPWWYGLGYPILWLAVGVSLGITGRDSMIAISTESTIALIVCAFIGTLLYVIAYAFDKYEKQKKDAEEIKDKVVKSGRDPEDPAVLTVSEKWEITKCLKFDRLFIIADIVWVILACVVAVAGLYFYGGQYIEDSMPKFAFAGFIVGIISAWFIGEAFIKTIASGKWSEKAADAFRTVKPLVEETVAKVAGASRFDELVKKYIDAGLSKKEAKKKASEKIADEVE